MKTTIGIKFDHNTINAVVSQKDENTEKVRILDVCARKVPLTPQEREDFVRVKNNSEAEARHARRSARRNRQRYLLRRRQLAETLSDAGMIDENTALNDSELKHQYRTWQMRALAPIEEISLEDLARVFMMMNKHRGYKETKGAKDPKEGTIIDGLSVAKILAQKNITPGQYLLQNSEEKSGKAVFYPSELTKELRCIIFEQMKYHPEVLSDETVAFLLNCTKKSARQIFSKYSSKNEVKDKNKFKKDILLARVKALSEKVELSYLAEIIPEIIGQINDGSALLGQMSDRSKDAMLKNQTPGQWIYSHIQEDKNGFSTRSQSFFRSDYKQEFEMIWHTQKQYHKELTDELKEKIQDKILYYQRELKAVKGGYCPFESFKIQVIDKTTGEISVRNAGCRTAPKSSPLFQEFRMYNDLNNVTYSLQNSTVKYNLDKEQMDAVANKLRLTNTMSANALLKAAGLDSKIYELNFKEIKGNATLAAINAALEPIAKKRGFSKIGNMLKAAGSFENLMNYDWNLSKEEYEKQPLVRLWILIDSYRCDESLTGMDTLKKQIAERFNTDEEITEALAMVSFPTGHGKLSHKAMKKLMPHLIEGTNYYDACASEGYQVSVTEATTGLISSLPEIKKGELMNPIAEKIINQLIHVINELIEEYGNPDEIVIELPRSLNTNKKVRETINKEIAKREKENKIFAEKIRQITGNPNVSAMQILRYRLYEELKENGYRTLYSDRQLTPELILNTDLVHREHIIPQSVIFDDNYVNYTLEFAEVDRDKDDSPARDFVLSRYGDSGLERYLQRVKNLYDKKAISKAKYNYLCMTRGDVPNNILDKQTPARQYAMKELAKMLALVSHKVLYTVPAITKRLKTDWDLDDIATEINIEDYKKAGRVTAKKTVEGKPYNEIKVRDYIKNKWVDKRWNPTMDPRSSIVDAAVISLTTQSHIIYLNNLSNAKEKGSQFWALKNKLTEFSSDKRMFRLPDTDSPLKETLKDMMSNTLVSSKPESKLICRKKNISKKQSGNNVQVTIVPRGALHEESIFRKLEAMVPCEVKLNTKTTIEDVNNILNPTFKNAVMNRINEFNGNISKALGGKNTLTKKPIWIDEEHTKCVPDIVETKRKEIFFIIRKKIDENINIDKICSDKVKEALKQRVMLKGSLKAAVEDLLTNPLIVDGKKVTRVLVKEKKTNMMHLHHKKDSRGKIILDAQGKPIPCDFVKPGNNHHLEIFRTKDGKLVPRTATFFECIDKINKGENPYSKEYNKDKGWTYKMSISKGDAVIFADESIGFNPSRLSLEELKSSNNISSNLYYVQKISEESNNYVFRHHTDNNKTIDSELKNIKLKILSNVSHLDGCVKVRLNHIGKIVQILEKID